VHAAISCKHDNYTLNENTSKQKNKTLNAARTIALPVVWAIIQLKIFNEYFCYSYIEHQDGRGKMKFVR